MVPSRLSSAGSQPRHGSEKVRQRVLQRLVDAAQPSEHDALSPSAQTAEWDPAAQAWRSSRRWLPGRVRVRRRTRDPVGTLVDFRFGDVAERVCWYFPGYDAPLDQIGDLAAALR